MVIPSAEMTGARSRERWKRRSRASTRASSSRASNGRATTSSAPASRNRIRSSTFSLALTHMTGTAAIDGVARISRQISIVDFGPVVTSRMTSWCSETLLKASSASFVSVTV